MIDDRFAEVEQTAPPPTSGFMVLPIAAVEPCASPMQWLYQHLYEQAVQVNHPARTHDLFAVMN